MQRNLRQSGNIVGIPRKSAQVPQKIAEDDEEMKDEPPAKVRHVDPPRSTGIFSNPPEARLLTNLTAMSKNEMQPAPNFEAQMKDDYMAGSSSNVNYNLYALSNPILNKFFTSVATQQNHGLEVAEPEDPGNLEIEGYGNILEEPRLINHTYTLPKYPPVDPTKNVRFTEKFAIVSNRLMGNMVQYEKTAEYSSSEADAAMMGEFTDTNPILGELLSDLEQEGASNVVHPEDIAGDSVDPDGNFFAHFFRGGI
jgi:hypothetical protein